MGVSPPSAGNRRAGLVRTFPCAMFWIRDMPKSAEVTRPLTWDSDDPTGIAVMRDSWSTNGWFAAFKYGYVGGAHGHMDVGSFILDACGTRWAGDIGPENYTKMESAGITLWNFKQNSTRWSLYRLNNSSHNLIVPEGVLEKVGSSGKLISLAEKPDGSCEAAFDLDAVYAPDLRRWRRNAQLKANGGGFVVEDEVHGARVPVSWGFATRAEVKVSGSTAVLSLNGCAIITASTPSRAPRSARLIFPPPSSSAGQPKTTTLPGIFFFTSSSFTINAAEMALPIA